MLAQFRLALTNEAPPQDFQFTRGARVGSELAIEAVGLADQDQADGGGDHNDQTSPHEAAQEVGEGGGHGVGAVEFYAAEILGIKTRFLRCRSQCFELCDAIAASGASCDPPILGLLLAALTLAFLLRIVLTWYPQVDLTAGAWPLIAWPTEPVLALTRKVVAPIGGVDVTPVIWVGLLSLLRELLVGQQGLLSQVLMRSQAIS